MNEHGQITSVYCHSDGFPRGVGQILFDYYNSEERARALMDGGNLSELGIVEGGKIEFLEGRDWQPSQRGKGWPDVAKQSVLYGRDRGDIDAHPRASVDFETLKRELLLGCFGPEHLYL